MKYSIIIPAYNRSCLLERCLKHLSGLNKPDFDYEVLVADNGPTDKNKRVYESFIGKIPNLSYFYEKESGLLVGRHSGARKAQGEILCYLDEDSFVDKNWLIAIEKAFKNPEIKIATGLVLPEYEVKPPEWLKYAWIKNKHGKYLGSLSLLDFGQKEKIVSPLFVFGCNFIIRKQVFFDFKGTHPCSMPEGLFEYIGDGETGLAKKLVLKGIQALYSPEIKINHFVADSRMTEDYFVKRFFHEGICNSFTEYRQKYGLYGKERNKYLVLANYFRFFEKLSRHFAEKLLFSHDDNYKKCQKILSEAKKSYNKGKLFHKEKVENNPELLKYVLKENYL